MKTTELKNKSQEELHKILEESLQKLQELKFNISAGKVKNVRTLRELKKDIARILTILNETPQ
ncbi:MAG: 50S ribosomal protein L29 [Parcubacteria group bacterium]|nr:50S ribosomal protein L29 [Parcubacteria group bacterium]